MEFLNCSYGEEFDRLPLKHVTVGSVHTGLAGGDADTPARCIAVEGVGFICTEAHPVGQLRPCCLGDSWSLGAQEGKSRLISCVLCAAVNASLKGEPQLSARPWLCT